MKPGLPAILRRTRAAAYACAAFAALTTAAHAAESTVPPPVAVALCAVNGAGASATAPAGWILTAKSDGSKVSLRNADGAMGADWGLASVAAPEHDSDGACEASARAQLIRTLRAMGDNGVPADTAAPPAYASYFAACPFETDAHRGVLFYHQYQWDENQSVISYYVAWTDKNRWSASGFVAVNVALSIRAANPRTALNPFWADGKQTEAERELRRIGAAYNQEAHILLRPANDSALEVTLLADAEPKPRRSRCAAVKADRRR